MIRIQSSRYPYRRCAPVFTFGQKEIFRLMEAKPKGKVVREKKIEPEGKVIGQTNQARESAGEGKPTITL